MNLKDEIYGLNISITKELTQLKEEVSKLKKELTNKENTTEKLIETIFNQQKVIEDLYKCYANSKEYECIVFVPYRGKPVVIKDGEILSTKRTTGFDIDWAWDRSTEVTIRND